MDTGGLTTFDFVALFVLVVSSLIALMRGFVREALTLAAFVAAALGALWTRPIIAGLIEPHVGSALVANILAVSAAFIVIFLAVSFITSALGAGRRGEPVHPLDRLLGFFFGAARGLIAIGLMVLVFHTALPGAQARWMTDARIYPLAYSVADMLQGLAPDGSWAQGAPDRALPPDRPDTADSSEAEEDRQDFDQNELERRIRSAIEDEPG